MHVGSRDWSHEHHTGRSSQSEDRLVTHRLHPLQADQVGRIEEETTDAACRISAEAQMVPALMALAILITVLVSPQSSVIFFWFQTLGKGYIVAMLGELNLSTLCLMID